MTIKTEFLEKGKRCNMERLPHWVIPDSTPAFFDHESKTAIEMVAKLYGKTNELVDDYNKFVDRVNKHIEDFEKGITTDFETFKVSLRQEFQDFIDVVNLKIVKQDVVIADAVNYMKTNLKETLNTLLENMTANNELALSVSYDETNESLTFVLQVE